MYKGILNNKNIVKRRVLEVESSSEGIVCNIYGPQTQHIKLPIYIKKVFGDACSNLRFITIVVDKVEYIVHNIEYSHLHERVLCVDLMKFSENYIIKKKKVKLFFVSSDRSKFEIIKDFVMIKKAVILDMLNLSEEIDVALIKSRVVKSKHISPFFSDADLVKKL